jgi:hypothetical protein
MGMIVDTLCFDRSWDVLGSGVGIKRATCHLYEVARSERAAIKLFFSVPFKHIIGKRV